MIFLLKYDRKRGEIRELTPFPIGERAQAQRERLAVELGLYKLGEKAEVVLLEASDEQTLRRTHQRYFKSPKELIESMADSEAIQ
jgi:hypothetical protein